MKNETPDGHLARLFREQRLADEASAPELDRLLARTPRRGASPETIRRFAFSAATLAVVALIVVILWPSRPPQPPAIQIADWISPTDSLLQTSYSDLWSGLPELVSSELSVSAESAASSERTKGVSR
jgi:hypothetical protein